MNSLRNSVRLVGHLGNNPEVKEIASGKKVVKSNSFLELKPELAKEWHSTKNGTLLPQNIYARSGKDVYWECVKGDDDRNRWMFPDAQSSDW